MVESAMTHNYPLPVIALGAHPLHATLNAFPIACFTLALLSDITYWQTSNLLWLHFSEWLLFVGLMVGILALMARAVDYLVRRMRPPWLAVIAAVLVLVLAAINNFVHTADGWTAVVPYGLILSAATVILMIVTGWLGVARHV
jgi:uncharacterized membrane protein